MPSKHAPLIPLPGLLDVGDFEYWKIKTVLARIDSPEQLRQIELHSPQIQGEDAELWQAFIRRDIPNWKEKNYIPKNPNKWYEIYCKYKKEQQRQLDKDEAELKARMAELSKKKATNVSKIVELRKLPKVPRDRTMMANDGGVPLGRNQETGVIRRNASSLSWTSGSKTKMTDGKSVMTRARREAKEISQRGKLTTPTKKLQRMVGKVTQAPVGMVNEYRRERMAAHGPVRILSKKKDVQGQSEASFGGRSLQEREGRLRALTMSRGQAPAAAQGTLVGSSDDEDEDDDDLEDLFEEKPKRQDRPSPSTSSQTTVKSSSTAIRHVASSSATSSSSSRPASRPNPSDIISSMISKPRPKSSLSVPAPSHSSTPHTISRTPSPGQGVTKGVIKRRQPVDIFNRAASKKPRFR